MKYLNNILINWDNSDFNDSKFLHSDNISKEIGLFSTSKIKCTDYPTDFYSLTCIIEKRISDTLFDGLEVCDLRMISFSKIKESDKSDILTSLFEDINGLNYPKIINVSNWDISECEDMSYCFYKCKGLQRIIGLNTWNTGRIRTAQAMFAHCHDLKDIGDLSKWKTSKLYNIRNMFRHCYSLSPLDQSKKMIFDYKKWIKFGKVHSKAFMSKNFVDEPLKFSDFICFKNLPGNLTVDNILN